METEIKTKPAAKNLNKFAYSAFVVAGIAFLILKDFSQASIFWGLALVFDPFNPATPFQKRPAYQQIWLIVHLLITITLFVLMLIAK